MHRSPVRAALLFLAAPAVLAAQAPAGAPPAAPPPLPTRWTVDAAHSAVTFRVRHLGLAWVNGAFRQWSADLTFDPARLETSSVAVSFQTASVDTENERRDNDLKANYLQVDSFPQMTFASRSVERTAPDRLRITGDLTIRGITRSVVLDTEHSGILNTSRGRRMAFNATTTVRRQDFGILLNRFMEGAQVVGDDVRITIDLELIGPPA